MMNSRGVCLPCTNQNGRLDTPRERSYWVEVLDVPVAASVGGLSFAAVAEDWSGRGPRGRLRRRPEIDESGRIVMSGGDSQRAERCILWVHDR